MLRRQGISQGPDAFAYHGKSFLEKYFGVHRTMKKVKMGTLNYIQVQSELYFPTYVGVFVDPGKSDTHSSRLERTTQLPIQ